MARQEQTVSAGTKSVAPVTVGQIPVYTVGIPVPTISDSAYAQADNGRQIIAGIGAFVNAGQVSPNPIVVIGDGASGWGIGAIALGRNVVAGQNAARDGAIALGYGVVTDAKNGIRIGSSLAFGGAFDDTIVIGTQAVSTRPGVCIGKGATQAGPDAVSIGTSCSSAEGSSVAIGKSASCVNSGLGTPTKNVAIGDSAVCNPTFASSAGGIVAIGAGASTNAQNSVALGASAAVTGVNVVGSVALGAFATSTRSFECVIGHNVNNPITLLSLTPGVGVMAGIRGLGGSGVGVRNAADNLTIFQVDESAGANEVRMLVYDVTAAALRRVTIGAADSGGVGFRYLRIPN